MIYFITKGAHEVVEVPDELEIKNSLSPQDIDWMKSVEVLGLDTETNSLDPYIGSILLLILGNDEHQYVIDCRTIDCEQLLLALIGHKPEEHPELSPIKNMKLYRRLSRLLIGANLKFDYKMIKVKWNIELTKMYDVMIAEQRLLQGMDEFNPKQNRRVPLSASLEAIVHRRLGFVPSEMDKRVRLEFVGANPATFKFTNKHIFYSGGDVRHLPKIRGIQKQEIERLNLQFLIYKIEFPLIKVLADAELTGMCIDEEKWKENIRKNKEEKFKTECFLDEEVRRLRDTLLPVEERKWLKGGRFDRIRIKPQEVIQDNLFGDLFEEIEINPTGKEKKKGKVDSPYINYSSNDQVVSIMGRLKQPVPVHNSKTKAPFDPEVPQFIIEKGKIKIDKSWIAPNSFTMNADALESYRIENPNSPVKTFVIELAKFREYVTALGTFGEEFLRKYKNRITKRFHTLYRQCHAATSRLQSGDEDNGFYNSQNIKAKKEYREPFHDDGNWVNTTDLGGAEAVIMIDKARDEKFYEMAIVNDDAHSPLATAVWRGVGKFRMEKLAYIENDFMSHITSGGHLLSDEEVEKRYAEAKALSEIVISKTENTQKRTDFKPHTFGDIYGMGDKKRAKVLAISIEESKIAGEIQKKMIPKTYKMVNDNAKFAINNGYVIFNTRTNSRMWYSEILELQRNKGNIYDRENGHIKHAVESSAKNAPIQGTQADMVKELMVEIAREADRQDLDVLYLFQLLLQVHDETVYRFSKDVQLTFDLTNPKKPKVVDSNVKVEFVSDDGKVEMVTMPDFIKKWHTQVCNRYLSFIQMTAEQHVGKTWTK